LETGRAAEELAVPNAPTRLDRVWRRYLPGLGGIAVVSIGCVAWATISFGSVYHAWLYAAGVRVMVEPATVSFQEAKVGDVRHAVLLLRNLADKPVSVLGLTVSCTCVSTTDKLPVVIPYRGTRELHLTLDLAKVPAGQIDQTVVYHTDHRAAPSLTVRVSGRVIEP
jgi:hypothetical protein